MAEKCRVINCNAQAVSHGLCDTHRKRLERHGHLNDTRPSDWGTREKHPLYKTWCGLIRYHRLAIPIEWQDFWVFVREIPEKPSAKAKAFRPDKSKPWGLDNFYWRESSLSDEQKADRATYMREWQRQRRAVDKDYYKDLDLKKNYGVDLDWFNQQFDKQGGVCAICGKPEKTVIHGRQISLAVDHCHDTGQVRGLLCRGCNNSIGHFGHDINILEKAIQYLKTPPS